VGIATKRKLTMDRHKLARKIGYLFQGSFTLTGSAPGQSSPFMARLFDPSSTLPQFFNAAFKTALVVGAMLAVLRLGYAGFVYMTTDLPGSKGNARTIIGETVLGLLLLLAVWLILNQINPQILNLDILQKITPAGTIVAPMMMPPPAPFMPPAPDQTVVAPTDSAVPGWCTVNSQGQNTLCFTGPQAERNCITQFTSRGLEPNCRQR
jgi:hypothetical protein